MTLNMDSADLSAPELQAVAAIWRRERRILSTSFSGTSMLPHIAPGQAVRVLCGHIPVKGDVVVCHFDNQLRVHRVVARTPASDATGWLLTWGDNNPLPDAPTRWPQVIGVLEGQGVSRMTGGRHLLLRSLTWRCVDAGQLARRVALSYRIRAAWQAGPLVFAIKSIRALLRGRSPC
jgi:hypothetical protein